MKDFGRSGTTNLRASTISKDDFSLMSDISSKNSASPAMARRTTMATAKSSSNTKSMAVTTIQEEDEDIFALDPKLAKKKEKQAAKAKLQKTKF